MANVIELENIVWIALNQIEFNILYQMKAYISGSNVHGHSQQ